MKKSIFHGAFDAPKKQTETFTENKVHLILIELSFYSRYLFERLEKEKDFKKSKKEFEKLFTDAIKKHISKETIKEHIELYAKDCPEADECKRQIKGKWDY